MAYVDFLSVIHKSTKRDYLARVNDPEFPKAKAAALAKQWAFDYWDGDRRINYGGYRYDGRWAKVAKAMTEHYGIKAGDTILDVGCGKGFLVYDFTQVVPGIDVRGIDISEYAIDDAKDEVKDRVQVANGRRAAVCRQVVRSRRFDQRAAQPALLRPRQGAARDGASRPQPQIYLRRVVSQRGREGEPAVLAGDLRSL